MPDNFFNILVYAAAVIAAAIAIKIALRYRADRRRHSCCVFCDGRGGEHSFHCQRPGVRS